MALAHYVLALNIKYENTYIYIYLVYKQWTIQSKSWKIYYDPAGYGSINETLKDAEKYDKSITYDDVKKWKASQAFGQKAKPRGMNSFITDAPHE